MLLFLALAAIGLAAGLAAYALGVRRPRAARPALGALLVLLLGKTWLDAHPHWEWWFAPWPAYAFVQGFVLYPIATAFFGLAASRLPVRWNRAAVGAVALFVLGHGLWRHAWLVRVETHGDARTADAEHHVRQSTMYTCGPAACAAALSWCGITIEERSMARLCLVRRGGSRLFDLYRGLVLGLEGRPFEVSIEALDAAQLLAGEMLVVAANGSGSHALCIRTIGGVAHVHDPLRLRREVWDADRLERDYRGPAIVIRRAAVAAPR